MYSTIAQECRYDQNLYYNSTPYIKACFKLYSVNGNTIVFQMSLSNHTKHIFSDTRYSNVIIVVCSEADENSHVLSFAFGVFG